MPYNAIEFMILKTTINYVLDHYQLPQCFCVLSQLYICMSCPACRSSLTSARMTCLCCVDVCVAGMAVDITLLFKASVKTVKTRNKAIGVGPESAKDELVRRNRPKNSFSNKAKEVVRSL